MPYTSKTYADMEILQGADYEMTLTLEGDTTGKQYLLSIAKDFVASTDFSGRTDGDGTSGNGYRTQISETNVANRGKLVASDSGTGSTVTITLYGEWTSSLDDDFDGVWELMEKDGSNYNRVAQGDIYVSKSTSRWDTVRTLTG